MENKFTTESQYPRRCVGPSPIPDAEKCVHGLKGGYFHMVDAQGKDTKGYNGIINWRCPTCFSEHKLQLRKK